MMYRDLQVESFKNFDELYTWLSVNRDAVKGFWLRYYKKNSGVESIAHPDAVRAALCWGWIDGLLNKYDETSYLVRFTPRRPKSVWSQVNVQNVEDLIKSKLMQPSGMAHVEAAKADGRWQRAYASQSTMTVPDAFLRMLKSHPTAYSQFQKLDKANLYAIGYRLSTAHSDLLFTKRANALIALLNEGKTIHPMKGTN